MGVAEAYTKLKNVLGPRVTNASHVLAAYGYPMVFTEDYRPPSIVAKPKTTEEVAEILKIANEERIPVYPRGNGSDLADGNVPIVREGSIVIDLKGMNKILEVDLERRVVVFEAGITWQRLNKYLIENYGYTTGILGPANAAGTVGGGIANNSVGGGGEPMFHNPGEHVVGMEVVLPTGEIVTLGSPGYNKYSKHWFGGRYLAGPDLAGLFIGDPGFLGIKTKIAMRIFPLPKAIIPKTVLVPGKAPGTVDDYLASTKNYIKISLELERQGDFGLSHGAFAMAYFDQLYVSYLGATEIFEPWSRIWDPMSGEPWTEGVFCYIIAGDSEEEALNRVRRIDKVCEKYGCKEFGERIEDGNFARWLLEKCGDVLYAHPLWMSAGASPQRGAQWYIYDMSWDRVIPALRDIVIHCLENRKLYTIARATAPSWVLAPVGGGVKLAEATHMRQDELPRNKEEIEAQRRIWNEKHMIYLSHGGVPIWKGVLYTLKMVRWGIFDDSYISLLRKIKEALDPNGILSPGEFGYGIPEDYEVW